MKLSKLKQQLIEKNNALPDNKRRVSSIRKGFERKPRTIIGESVVYSDQTIDKKDIQEVTTYQQSYNLSELKALEEMNNQDEEIILSSIKRDVDSNLEEVDINNIKIIGITGSRGKSTTAFIVHKYLKSLGYKSILYSSIMIDSPASYVNRNEACEMPLQNESILLDIIEEAEAIAADYIVLEINESAIAKGLIKGIPFTVRALTNIFPQHNEEQYSPEEYVRLKKSVFEDIPSDEDCICVFGLTGSLSREDFNNLLKLNNHPKITYGSKYICEIRNANYTNLDCLLHGMEDTLNGLKMQIRLKAKSYDFTTSIILPHNSLNLTCALAIIEALKLFDEAKFNECISKLKIPGREEVIKANQRTIVIGLYLGPALENFKKYKENNEANRVTAVVGAIGTGFVGWSKEFSTELFISKRSSARRFAINYAKNNADYIYITSNDNAAENALSIAEELQSYIGGQVPSCIIVDREEAIKKAISESQTNDIIYIAGRGNRRLFCDTANTMKLIQDKEVVLKVLKDLGW